MFRQYRQLEVNEFIIAFGDCSAGGLDYSACQFYSPSKKDYPLVYHSKALATVMTNAIVPVLEKIADVTNIKPVIAYERNNGGVFEMERIAAMNRLGKYQIYMMSNVGKSDNPDPTRLGWDTNSSTRPRMLSDFKEAVDSKIVTIYDKFTIEELYSFIVSQTASGWRAEAERGAHDDLVMSAAGAYEISLDEHIKPLPYQSLSLQSIAYRNIQAQKKWAI